MKWQRSAVEIRGETLNLDQSFQIGHFAYALASQPLTGGRLLGGGGSGMPIRKCSPVAFRFHRVRWFIGWLSTMAPSCQ